MNCKTVKFKELYAVDSKNGIYKSAEFHGTGTRIVNMGELFAYGFIGSQDMRRIIVDEKEKAAFHLEEGDLLFARRSLVESGAGKSSIVLNLTSAAVFESSIIRVRLNKTICNPLFYYYWFKSHEGISVISALVNGVNVKGIKSSALKEISVALPELSLQNRISEVLYKYDALIENNQKQIKLLEEAAQRLYKEWFVDLRFPGYEEVKVVDGVPEGWKKVELQDVISKITTGLNPRKNFVLGNGSNYYVTIKNMGENTIYLDSRCDRVDDDALEKINKRSDLQIGDILFSGIGTIGRVYLIDISTDNWNVSESVFTIRANEQISKELLYMILLSNDMQTYCDQNAHGVAQRGIRMADLKKYKFNLPDKQTRKQFDLYITPYINKAKLLQKEIVVLTEARDRLLPKLMSGEIEV